MKENILFDYTAHSIQITSLYLTLTQKKTLVSLHTKHQSLPDTDTQSNNG